MGTKTVFIALISGFCFMANTQTKQVFVENLYGYLKNKNELHVSFTVSRPSEFERIFIKLGDDIDRGNVKTFIYNVTGDGRNFFINQETKKEIIEGNKIKIVITVDEPVSPRYITVFGQVKEGTFTNKVFYHLKSDQ